MKEFEKQYDASVSTKSIVVPGMSKGQKRRAIKNEKLQKRKLFQQYLENLKNKKANKGLFTLGELGQSLEGMEFDLGVSLQKEEEAKHKGVSSKAKHSIGNEEILRTQKILQHQAFLSNPLGVIKQHIVNSINLKEAQENKKKEDMKKKPSKKKEGMMTYITAGHYEYTLRRWLDHFEPAQILVVFTEDLLLDRKRVILDIFNWLGVPSNRTNLEDDHINQLINEGQTSKVNDPVTEQILCDYFRPLNSKLEKLTGYIPESWKC